MKNVATGVILDLAGFIVQSIACLCDDVGPNDFGLTCVAQTQFQ
jgi:hypothetical protein